MGSAFGGVWGSAPASSLSATLPLRHSALKKTVLALALAFLCNGIANALPLAWRADWPDCKPVEKLVHRGTDVELQPTWYIYGTPAASTNWTLTTYVQTNCVGQWFGPLPGASFSHTNDVGAASYGVMVRAETPDGSVNYTAFARLRMLDSPGYTPGALPLPVPFLDFANVEVRNPPWPSAIASATNALDQSLTSRISLSSRSSTNYTDSAIAAASTNYYTIAETDDAIDALAAYYITANAEGDAFPSVAALTNATAYYSGGALRTPTRNDYAVVLADETHGGAEWRYIYAVHEGATTGQWEAQYPIETNDYEALANKPSINGVELSGNQTAATLGLATPAITNNLATADALNIVDGTANDAKVAASEADGKAQSALDGLSARPTYAEAATTATNAADYAVATADTSYPRFLSVTDHNQSVQFVLIAPGDVLNIQIPTGSAETKDWIVYAYFSAETTLVLPAATWWMADESYTNAIPASTPTAFYFSQVDDGIYTISRQELKPITITNP